MALEKVSLIDKIEIIQNGIVQVCTLTIIIEDGVEITRALHRSTVAPGDDYSNMDARVQAICGVVHTPEAINNYRLTAN